MKHRYALISSIAILMLWWLGAMYLDNDIILPMPMDVLLKMQAQMASPDFYTIVFTTLIRSMQGLCIAFFIAMIGALCSYYSKILQALLAPIILLAKSIPNISYIIIILIWFSRETSATIITFLILFPMFYENFLQGAKAKDEKLHAVLHIYPISHIDQILHIDLPMMKPFIRASLSSGIGLAFKVGVMAEILGQVDQGIGRELQYCRIDLDMAGIFAWTLWIILLLMLLQTAMNTMMKPTHNE